jgi:hypothetical protein
MSTSCIEFGKVYIFYKKNLYKVVKFSRNLSKNTFMKLWFLPFWGQINSEILFFPEGKV